MQAGRQQTRHSVFDGHAKIIPFYSLFARLQRMNWTAGFVVLGADE